MIELQPLKLLKTLVNLKSHKLYCPEMSHTFSLSYDENLQGYPHTLTYDITSFRNSNELILSTSIYHNIITLSHQYMLFIPA